MSFILPSIDQLDVSKDLIDAANRASLSTTSILLTPLPRLADLLKVKIPIAQSYVRQVSQSITPSTKRLSEIYDQEQNVAGPSRSHVSEEINSSYSTRKGKGKEKWVSTGDVDLDQALGGGLRRGLLYEISGESAAGKSHLALHLALTFQLPSLTSSPGGSLILTSERELSTDRLIQLGNHLLSIHEPDLNPYTRKKEGRVRDLLDNILTNRVGDVDALEHALNYAIPAILESKLAISQQQSQDDGPILPIRLIILDSITALFRGSGSDNEKPSLPNVNSLTERSKHLCIISDLLKSLAFKYDLTILIINQVADVFSFNNNNNNNTFSSFNPTQPTTYSQPTSSFTQTQAFTGSPIKDELGIEEDVPMLYKSQSRWFSGENEQLKKEASLGIVWANSINVRIMLSRTARRRRLHQIDLTSHKRIKLEEEEKKTIEEIEYDKSQGKRKLNAMEIHAKKMKEDEEDIKPTLIRRLNIVFSPFSPSSTVDYVITESGIHTLENTYKKSDITELVMKRKIKEEKLRQEEEQILNGDYQNLGNNRFDFKLLEEEDDQNQEDNEYEDVYDEFGDLPDSFWQGQFDSTEDAINAQKYEQDQLSISNNDNNSDRLSINNSNNDNVSDRASQISKDSIRLEGLSDLGYNNSLAGENSVIESEGGQENTSVANSA